MAASSAMMAEMISAGVSPGMLIISSPTEQTAVIASSFVRERAPTRSTDHAGVLCDGDECAGQAADMRRCHDAALLTASLSRARQAVVPCAAALKTHFLQNMSDAVTDCRRRGEGEVDDAERYTQTAGSFLCDELSHAGNFERCFLSRYQRPP